MQGRQEEQVLTPVGHTGGPQWGVQVAFLFPRLSWSWSYFQSFILPHLMETVLRRTPSVRGYWGFV